MQTTNAPSRNSEIIHAAEVWRSIGNFYKWLEKNGLHSYDPYDLWGTPFGLFSRRLYYEKRKIALPLIAPFVAVEFLCPQIRALFVSKTRYAMVDAQLGLAFLNLFRITDDKSYLPYALERLMAHPDFAWTARGPQDWKTRPADWPPTRYEAKAIKGPPSYLAWLRKKPDPAPRDPDWSDRTANS